MRSGAALPATSPIPLTRWMCWPSWAGLILPGCAACFGRRAGGCAHFDGWLYQQRGGSVRGAALPRGGQGGVCQPCFGGACRPYGAGCFGQSAAHHRQPASGRGAPARWLPSRCGIWLWPSTAAAIPLRRAALRRTPHNADVGYRRRSQRQKRLCGAPCRAERRPALLPCHHAGVGCRVRRAGG